MAGRDRAGIVSGVGAMVMAIRKRNEEKSTGIYLLRKMYISLMVNRPKEARRISISTSMLQPWEL